MWRVLYGNIYSKISVFITVNYKGLWEKNDQWEKRYLLKALFSFIYIVPNNNNGHLKAICIVR